MFQGTQVNGRYFSLFIWMTTRSGQPYTVEPEMSSVPNVADMIATMMQRMEQLNNNTQAQLEKQGALTTQIAQQLGELSDQVIALEHPRLSTPIHDHQNSQPVGGNRIPSEGRQFQNYDSDEDHVHGEIPTRGRQGRRHDNLDDDIVRQVRVEAPLFDGSLDPRFAKTGSKIWISIFHGMTFLKQEELGSPR